LFRGNKEADIRRNLVSRGLIKGIIGLPANLFYGTGIPACVVLIDKEHAQARTGVFMVDASKGFLKDGNKNRLRSQDIHKIVDVFTRQIELPRYSRMVPVAEISNPANDYNLNLPRYIDASEPEDLHDLDAHLNGGIPVRDIDALEAWWRVFPTLRKALFQDNGPACAKASAGRRDDYREPRAPAHELKATVTGHLEFKAFAGRVAGVFEGWRAAHAPSLRGIKIDDRPRELIHTLSEDLLVRFADLPLVSRYDVYQRLMDYWADTMQDDVYLIAADGWQEAARPRGIVEDKARKIKETPNLAIGRKKYKMDLVPPALVVARYFAKEQTEVEALQAQQETAAQVLEEFIEEHSGEEGLLAEAANDRGKVTKGVLTGRLKAIAGDAESNDERDALERCLALIDADSEASKAVKEAQAALDAKVLARYGKLTEAEIKTLVVEDKWLASLRAAIDGEVQRAMQQLARRVKELEERYARPLPALECEVEALSAKVEKHVEKMGLAWG
jgi:type I restriction enzyme M protein